MLLRETGPFAGWKKGGRIEWWFSWGWKLKGSRGRGVGGNRDTQQTRWGLWRSKKCWASQHVEKRMLQRWMIWTAERWTWWRAWERERGVTFKLRGTESGSTNANMSVAELKGTAGYQLDRERCRDAGRCDMVTFASTNGLSGFSRTVWCYAPDCEPRMHLAQPQ